MAEASAAFHLQDAAGIGAKNDQVRAPVPRRQHPNIPDRALALTRGGALLQQQAETHRDLQRLCQKIKIIIIFMFSGHTPLEKITFDINQALCPPPQI